MTYQQNVSNGIIPTLVSERITLRTHSLSDFEECCSIWENQLVAKYTGGKTKTPEEVWRHLLMFQGSWVTFGYGYWLIESNDNGSIIGAVGISNLKRENVTKECGDAELGYVLHPSFWGKGYAVDSCNLVIDWFSKNFESLRVFAVISRGNERSINVAVKTGLKYAFTINDNKDLVYQLKN